MKNICYVWFFLGCVNICLGQFDDEVKKNDKNALRTSSNTSSSNDANFLPNNKNFERALQQKFNKHQQNKIQNQQRQDLKYKGIITAKMMYEKQAKNALSELNQSYAQIDQNLGAFTSKTKVIVLLCRDHGAPDGDIVTVYLNGMPIVSKLTLQNQFYQFAVPLKKGVNNIYFKALNQGTSGPNTAHFMIFDQNQQVIVNNQWNLATGAKATLSIARE